MKWNVILQTDGKTDLGIYNIFDDVGFRLAIEKLFEKKYDKKRFMEELDREEHFSCWAKIEWETVFTTWPPYIDREEIDRIITEYHHKRKQGEPLPERVYVNLDTNIKIDVYAQLRANWERFSEYVWRESQK